MTPKLSQDRPIHFIGAGGIGMSALALILVLKGFKVTGSDSIENENIKGLRKQGVHIFDEQIAANIPRIRSISNRRPLIIISSAIPTENPELLAAQREGLDIWHRSDLLAALIQKQPAIAVAGSHGKTTTSTFLTTLLALANQNPTALIGGLVPLYGTNAHAGSGRLLVAEADESDGSLVKFKPELGIITNLDLDHTDHYLNLSDLIQTMQRFGRNSKKLLINRDCKNLQVNFKGFANWSVKSKEADFAAIPIEINGEKTIADLYEQGKLITRISLPIPGIHNLSNAIGAIAACRLQGLEFDMINSNIKNLKTPKRRFDLRGVWNERLIVDDYAHHPNEIKVTLSMAKLILESGETHLPIQPKRIITIFQPHRYTRTKEFLTQFAIELSNSDFLIIAPIYSASETPIKHINAKKLAHEVQSINNSLPILVANSLQELTEMVKSNSRKNDLILSIGAGDINTLWERLNTKESTNQWISNIAA